MNSENLSPEVKWDARYKCTRASVGDELEADLRRLVSDGSVQAGGVTDREGAGEGDSSGPEVVQVG